MKKRIIIVGAGYAGVMTARKLAKKFIQKTEYEIVLIDDHPFFTYRTSLHKVATKRIESSAVQFDLRQIFMHQKNVKIVTAHVETVDSKCHKLQTSIGIIDYYKLIWAGGVEAKSDGIPGVVEYAFPFWSLDQATSLRVHIEEIIRQGAIELDESERKQKLRLIVVGGGYLGIQILGELLDERRILAKANQMQAREIELILVEEHAEILSDLNDVKVSHKVENYLKHQGVTVYKKMRVTEIFKDHIVLENNNIMTNTVIWAGGTQGRAQVSDLNLSQNSEQYLQVNLEMRVQDQDDIYALGDAVVQPLPDYLKKDQKVDMVIPKRGEYRYFWPKNVHTAVDQSLKVSDNISVKLLNRGDVTAFKLYSQRIFISVGSRYGIAVFKNGFTMTGFLAHGFKHISNLHFLAKLGSFYQMYLYLQREIFSRPQHIISGKGNISNTGNILWSLPLRLATGIFLIITGVTIGGGFGSIFAGVGLALFVGFMTTIAGFITFILSLIMLGTSFSISALLLPFVGIALMNGSGRSFGVDYWLVPFIQKNLGMFITGDSHASYNDLDD